MSNPPLADLTKHPHPALSELPILSSELSEWQGVFFNYYNHPAYESPEFEYTQHIIGITGNKHPMRSEHRFDGCVQTHYCQPGEVLFIPARKSYSSYCHRSTYRYANSNIIFVGYYCDFYIEAVGKKDCEIR